MERLRDRLEGLRSALQVTGEALSQRHPSVPLKRGPSPASETELSGIVNDPNAWAIEPDQPRYILDFVKCIVTVSVRTNEIVDGLPPLEIFLSSK